MAKESKQKGNYKGRHVGTLGMKKWHGKQKSGWMGFHSPPEFSKLCSKVEPKLCDSKYMYRKFFKAIIL